MAQSLEDKIIGLYSLGTSLRDISAHIKETYDTDISATTLSCLASFNDPGHTPHNKKPPKPRSKRLSKTIWFRLFNL